MPVLSPRPSAPVLSAWLSAVDAHAAAVARLRVAVAALSADPSPTAWDAAAAAADAADAASVPMADAEYAVRVAMGGPR